MRQHSATAASRPDMMFVPVKTIEQQGILALHSARSLLVKQQTMLANAMRGLATEFGLTVPKGIGRLDELLVLVDADKTFPEKARQVFTGLFDQCRALAESIRALEAEIVAHARQDETARRLANDPWRWPDHRVADRSDCRRHQPVQKRTALRRLARTGATTVFHRREDPPWSDHQNGQPGDTQVAGPRCHFDGLPSPAME